MQHLQTENQAGQTMGQTMGEILERGGRIKRCLKSICKVPGSSLN